MAPTRFVIGYDIADPRRLQRVRRMMCRYAAPLEYSVFFLMGSAADKDRCLREIGRLIDPAQDDVRCYALPLTRSPAADRARLPARRGAVDRIHALMAASDEKNSRPPASSSCLPHPAPGPPAPLPCCPTC